ncbi:hypothetical protein ACFT5B_06745 [Luteimicrobium sp. NPDC057192]|uniref:hypothetical protein n=1 Tax=Luteimicrobium sp. NPDC057192 TaxID=3346042 RepID=UPI00363F992E
MTLTATPAAADAATAHAAELLVGVLVVVGVVVRQLRVRRLDPRSTVAWVVLGVGAVVTFAALDDHPVTTRDVALLTVSAAVGGVLAVARAYTVRVWRTDRGVVRQGGVSTAVLWVVSIGQHLLVDGRADDRSLTDASLLAYLGFVLLVQNLVLVARARREGLLVSEPAGPAAPRR